jgi:regulator of protease activity HflC (stomatin/prohibitin superfamily)
MSVAAAGIVLVCTLLAVVATLAAASIRILREHQRAVVFRLGRLLGEKGPGLILLIPASTGWCAWTCGPSRSTSRRRT